MSECGPPEKDELSRISGHYCFLPVYGSFSFEANFKFANTSWGNIAVIIVHRPWNDPYASYPMYYLFKSTDGNIDYGWQKFF